MLREENILGDFMETDNLVRKVREEISSKLSVVKDARVFNLDYIPQKIYIRKEMEEIAKHIGTYLALGVPSHLIVYGSRGSGKTVSILTLMDSFKRLENAQYFYINVRDLPTSYKIYQKIAEVGKIGFSMSDLRREALKRLGDRTLLVLDEVDFLNDDDVLYHVSRSTKASMILMTQKVYWYKGIDESIKSSLQPIPIIFQDYNAEEMYSILRMRAEEGLHTWDDKVLRYLAALVVHNYNSDARIGIRALYRIATEKEEWNEEKIGKLLEEVLSEVEEDTIRRLNYKELIVLQALVNNNDTAQAYSFANNLFKQQIGQTISKPYFFRIINHLQNLGLISLVRKKVGRTYTYEAQILISKPLKKIEEKI
jgi:cell division control protein 6